MNKEEYKKIVKKNLPKEPRIKNGIVSFFSGGFLGMFSQIISNFLITTFELSKVSSYSLVCLIMVIVASLLTALGVFDDLINKFKCGLIIPTTGFAHSVTSSAMEYRKDGLITGLGSNFFKLAGSVILYGIIAAFFLCLLKVVFYV